MGFKICDSNVLVSANGRDTHADLECQLACIDALEEIIEKDILVLDRSGEIIEEYSGYCQYSGQPGVGDMFFKYTYNNMYYDESCLLVDITSNNSGSYSEVPGEIDTAGFHKKDHKFIAAAAASGKSPAILNATDSDWYIHRAVIQKHGFIVLQLCPQHQNK